LADSVVFINGVPFKAIDNGDGTFKLDVSADVALTLSDAVTVSGGAGQIADVKVTLDGESVAVAMSSVTAAKLQKGAQTHTAITCTLANTDYASETVIPAGTKYIQVWAENAFKIAVDQATTSGLIGIPVPANNAITLPIVFGADGGDSKVHAQSPSAGTVVNIGYLQD